MVNPFLPSPGRASLLRLCGDIRNSISGDLHAGPNKLQNCQIHKNNYSFGVKP